MTAAVAIGADRDRRGTATVQQRCDGPAPMPGWSPSISTASAQSGRTRPRPAAIEDEQPAPWSGFSTTATPARSAPARTGAACAADHADELVERERADVLEHVLEQRRATVGKQLLGPAEAARRAGREHQPADGPLTRRGIAGVPRRVGRTAALAAEVGALAVDVEADRGGGDRDLHAADRVASTRRRRRRRGGLRRVRVALRDELGEDRDRDLLRRAGADSNPGRGVQLGAQLVGHLERARPPRPVRRSRRARHRARRRRAPRRSARSSPLPWEATITAASAGDGESSSEEPQTTS